MLHFEGGVNDEFRWLSLSQEYLRSISSPPSPGGALQSPPAGPPPGGAAPLDQALDMLFSRLPAGAVRAAVALTVLKAVDLGPISAVNFVQLEAAEAEAARQTALLTMSSLLSSELDAGAVPAAFTPAADGTAGVLMVFGEVVTRARRAAAGADRAATAATAATAAAASGASAVTGA